MKKKKKALPRPIPENIDIDCETPQVPLEELEAPEDLDEDTQEFFVSPAKYTESESLLESFGDDEPHLQEDGTITDGGGNVLLRPY